MEDPRIQYQSSVNPTSTYFLKVIVILTGCYWGLYRFISIPNLDAFLLMIGGMVNMAISITWWKKIELLAIETNFSIEVSKQTDKKTRDLYSYKEKFMEAICKERNYKSFNTNEYHDTLIPQLLAKAFLATYVAGIVLLTLRHI